MNEENKIMTVRFLHEWLGDLVEGGFGDMKIRCEDGCLHEDEVSSVRLNEGGSVKLFYGSFASE